MRVWITKYALTTGIAEVEVEVDAATPGIAVRKLGHYWIHLHPGEWHSTIEAAIAAAKQMRQRKIISLEKQLARLRAFRFDAEPERSEACTE